MSSKPVNFVSVNDIEANRQLQKDAREEILTKAQKTYEIRERKEKLSKERGEDKWMLPSVEERISSKKSKKHKKEKKKKKKKGKKHRKQESAKDSSTSSESEETEWVEATNSDEVDIKSVDQSQRDDWMVMPPALFPCMSRDEIKNRKKSKGDDDSKKRIDLDKMGQSDRELNPYWQDGGIGLPSEQMKGKVDKSKVVVGDGGLSWLKRAYRRVKEQAEEQGRSLEEVAAERWGSLAKLENLIRESEEKNSDGRTRTYSSYKSRRYNRDGKPSGNYRRSSSSTNFHRPDADVDSHNRNRYDRVDRGSGRWRKHDRLQADDNSSRSLNERAKSPIPRNSKKSESSSDDSSDDDDDEDVNSKPTVSCRALTDKEMNALGAKILKAEIMGNETLAQKLKAELEEARSLRSAAPSTAHSIASKAEETVILTRTDNKGMTRPLAPSKYPNEPTKGRRKRQKVDTHDKDGARVRYFADDDNISLKQMFEREKTSTAEDQNSMLSRLAGRGMETNDDMDDVIVSRANRKQSESKLQEKDRSKAIFEHKKMSSALEKCNFCFEGSKMPKHMIVAIGLKTYLCLPPRQSLTQGHCYIVPMQHVPCATQLDEDVWSEIQIFRKGLTKMFQDQDKDAIFFETSMFLKQFPHMILECVPLPKEVGDTAPIYFKKAILESESEWSQNKKLVDLKNKDVRRAIPKGLPYFSVDFGLENGFAHVIEDEKEFPSYFAKEIIGGMMDVEPRLWRNPIWENFENQRKKVVEFSDWWKPYDWTRRIKEDE